MEITINLPSGDNLQSEMYAVDALLHLRLSEARFIRLMHVMCGLLCAEEASDSMLTAATNAVLLLEEQAVLQQLPLGPVPQAHVALFWYLHGQRTRQALEEQDAELRVRFRQHGLHGMHCRPAADTSDTEPDGCLVCCGPVLAPGFTSCPHGSSVCDQCAARLDRCPLCRTDLEGASSRGPAVGPTSARSATNAPTASPETV